MNHTNKYHFFNPGDCIPEQVMFDYIDGKLDGKARHQVEKHLLDCELCSDAMEGLQLVKNRDRIRLIHNSVNSGSEKKEAKVIPFNYRTFTAVAASLVLLVGAFFFFKGFTSKEAMQQDMAVMKEEPVTISAPSETPETEPAQDDDAAASAIEEKDAEPASEEIVVSEAPSADNEKAEYYNRTEDTKGNGTVAVDQITVAESTTTGDDSFKDSKTIESPANSPVASGSGKWETDKLSKLEEKPADKSKTSPAGASVSKNAESVQQMEPKKRLLEKGKKKEQGQKQNAKESVAEEELAVNVPYAPESVKSETKADEDQKNLDFNSIEVTGNSALDLEQTVFTVVDQMPEFPGGQDSLNKYLSKFEYPASYRSEVKTFIYLSVTIDEKGKAIQPKVLKGLSAELDAEALKLVKNMPRWKPGKQNGKQVPVSVTLQVPVNPR